MKVSELIERLKEFPQDADILSYYDNRCGATSPNQIRFVEVDEHYKEEYPNGVVGLFEEEDDTFWIRNREEELEKNNNEKAYEQACQEWYDDHKHIKEFWVERRTQDLLKEINDKDRELVSQKMNELGIRSAYRKDIGLEERDYCAEHKQAEEQAEREWDDIHRQR